jgi:hypothetical protein
MSCEMQEVCASVRHTCCSWPDADLVGDLPHSTACRATPHSHSYTEAHDHADIWAVRPCTALLRRTNPADISCSAAAEWPTSLWRLVEGARLAVAAAIFMCCGDELKDTATLLSPPPTLVAFGQLSPQQGII